MVQGVVGDQRCCCVVRNRPVGYLDQLRTPPVDRPTDDASTEDDQREGHCEQREGKEGGHGEQDQHPVAQRPRPDPEHGLDHDRQHGRGEPQEQPGHEGGVALGDVEDGQSEHRQQPREHEEDSRDQATDGAVEQPAGVDRELLGLRPGQEHAVVEGVQEPLLPDPAPLVDESALHDGDLAGRTTERLQRDQEPGPNRRAEGYDVAHEGHDAQYVNLETRTGRHPPRGQRRRTRTVVINCSGQDDARPAIAHPHIAHAGRRDRRSRPAAVRPRGASKALVVADPHGGVSSWGLHAGSRHLQPDDCPARTTPPSTPTRRAGS